MRINSVWTCRFLPLNASQLAAGYFTDLVGKLVWPILLTCFLCFAVFLFREAIKDRIRALREMRRFGMRFDNVSIAERADIQFSGAGRTPQQTAERPSFQDKAGNLFWLGHDLMWTVDVIARGGPKARIMHGLTQSIHHLRSLEIFKTANAEQLIVTVRDHIIDLLNREITPKLRDEVATELYAILVGIGHFIQQSQPDFAANPVA